MVNHKVTCVCICFSPLAISLWIVSSHIAPMQLASMARFLESWNHCSSSPMMPGIAMNQSDKGNSSVLQIDRIYSSRNNQFVFKFCSIHFSITNSNFIDSGPLYFKQRCDDLDSYGSTTAIEIENSSFYLSQGISISLMDTETTVSIVSVVLSSPSFDNVSLALAIAQAPSLVCVDCDFRSKIVIQNVTVKDARKRDNND